MACGSKCQGLPEKSDSLFQGQSAAGKLNPADVARCHAVGQACGVVHTAGHALGYPMYELSAIVLEQGPEDCRNSVQARALQYTEKLLFHREQEPNLSAGWADFLRK